MGNEFMQTAPVFKDHVLQCDIVVKSIGCPRILSLLDDRVKIQVEDVDEVIGSQCACVALEYWLGTLLMHSVLCTYWDIAWVSLWRWLFRYTFLQSCLARHGSQILWLDMFESKKPRITLFSYIDSSHNLKAVSESPC